LDVLLRSIAIFIEVIILGAVFYFMLNGVRLILFDLGIRQRYTKVISMVFIAIGCVLATFLVSHLIAFYPPA